MSHDLHNGREGTIIYDGCAECDERAAEPLIALLNLDSGNFQALRARMLDVEFGEGGGYYSDNEARVGRALYRIAVLEERHGRIIR